MYSNRGTTLFLWTLLLVVTCEGSGAFAPNASGHASFQMKRTSKNRKLLLQPISQAATTTGAGDDMDTTTDAKENELGNASIPRGGAAGRSIVKLPKSVPPMPTLGDYRKFYFPCLALWIAGPLLSLVDTSFIGLSGPAGTSAQQLAALGPATTFFDGATYLFAFLNVATTNLYSSARAKGGEKSPQAEGVVRTAAKVAFVSGMGLLVFLLTFSRPLLALYIGE